MPAARDEADWSLREARVETKTGAVLGSVDCLIYRFCTRGHARRFGSHEWRSQMSTDRDTCLADPDPQ
jgi:hypothetical protein